MLCPPPQPPHTCHKRCHSPFFRSLLQSASAQVQPVPKTRPHNKVCYTTVQKFSHAQQSLRSNKIKPAPHTISTSPCQWRLSTLTDSESPRGALLPAPSGVHRGPDVPPMGARPERGYSGSSSRARCTHSTTRASQCMCMLLAIISYIAVPLLTDTSRRFSRGGGKGRSTGGGRRSRRGGGGGGFTLSDRPVSETATPAAAAPYSPLLVPSTIVTHTRHCCTAGLARH